MRKGRVALAAAITTLAVALLSACGPSVAGAGGLVGPASPSGSGAGASPGGSGSPGASSSPSPGAPAKPAPKGFVARDFTFTSLTSGWLLGYVGTCSASSCAAAIVHTGDGGKTWSAAVAPDARYVPVAQAGCDSACIWGLRFASSTVGYAYGPGTLFLTTDGGATWQHQPGGADALEIADGTALRVSHTTPGCPPECTYTVSTATVGSGSWKAVGTAPAIVGDGVKMLRVGHRAFIVVFQNPAGGREDAHATLLTSTDDGKHWTKRDDPCGTIGVNEDDTSDIAVSNGGALAVLCTLRGGAMQNVIVSTDAGVTFPHGGNVGGVAIGLANASTLLTQSDISGGTKPVLYRSTDSGSTSGAVTGEIGTVPEGYAGVIGFESDTVGRWVPGSGPVLTTTDAGAHWSEHDF